MAKEQMIDVYQVQSKRSDGTTFVDLVTGDKMTAKHYVDVWIKQILKVSGDYSIVPVQITYKEYLKLFGSDDLKKLERELSDGKDR